MMGMAFSYKCPTCGKNKKLFYGNGMISCSLIRPLDKSNYRDLALLCMNASNLNEEDILKIIEDEDCWLNEEFGNKLYVCPNCNYSSTNFEFVLNTKNHGTIIPEYKCSNCNNIMNLTDDNQDFILICDNCKHEISKEKPVIIYWD